MNKQKKIDLYFGFQNEDKIHKELEENFGELKNTCDNEVFDEIWKAIEYLIYKITSIIFYFIFIN